MSKRFIFFITCISFVSFLCFSQPFVDITSKNIQLLTKPKKMQFCYISFVKIDGKTYLIKQKRGADRLIGVVRDAVTATIAEKLSVTHNIAHRVDVIPAHVPFYGKVHSDWPATIHTVARGKAINKKISPYRRMNIKQGTTGVRYDMLWWMGKHKLLAQIVALDTFLSNFDRHRGNLFYDNIHDSFCAIDMDLSFTCNLAVLTQASLERIRSKWAHLTQKEIEALIIYKQTIEMLMESYKPEDIIALYDYFAVKAGFVGGAALYTDEIIRQMSADKQVIKQSYGDLEKVIKGVDEVVRMWNRYYPSVRMN